MNTITFSQLTHLGGSKAGKTLPAIVTYDGKPKFVMSKEEDVIVVSDLHIRVRNMLKAIEKRARIGMPTPTTITAEMS